jgi:hypothetical protein
MLRGREVGAAVTRLPTTSPHCPNYRVAPPGSLRSCETCGLTCDNDNVRHDGLCDNWSFVPDKQGRGGLTPEEWLASRFGGFRSEVLP